MRLIVNRYDLQDFYGRYGYEYHEADGEGQDPYITDEGGEIVASAPHYDHNWFEGDGPQMAELERNLRSQGFLSDVDATDGGEVPEESGD